MAINLFETHAKPLDTMYTEESYLKGKTSNQWSWDGAKTIKITSIVTQPPQNYNRTASANRYGTPKEVQDVLDIHTIRRDRSVSMVVDKGNNVQGGHLKEAGKVIKQEMQEQFIPESDQYALQEWATNAGFAIGLAAEPTKSTIVEHLVAIETRFANKRVPKTDRYVYIGNKYVGMLRQSLTDCDTITDKLLLKGVVGDFGTLHLVGVPDTDLPAGVYMIATHKNAVVYPVQIKDVKLHVDPPGFSGNLMEFRHIYDAFVIGTKKDGCVIVCDAAKVVATPVITKGTTTTTIAVTTTGGTIKYTTDGSDPRFSNSAQTYSAAITNLATGEKIRAVGVGTGLYVSDVAELIF